MLCILNVGTVLIGRCSDSPLDQEVLCIQTKHDKEDLGELCLSWLYKQTYLCNCYTVIMFSLCSLDINFPT